MKTQFRLFIISLLFVTTINSYGQEATFLKKGSKLLEKEKYEELIQLLNNNAHLVNNLSNGDLLIFCDQMAIAHNGIGDFQVAEFARLKKLHFYEQLSMTESFEYELALCELARLYLNYGRYANALEYYDKTIETMERINDKDYENRVNVLEGLAKTYELLGKKEELPPLYEEIKLIYEMKLGKIPSYYMFINTLAGYYLDKGDIEQAAILYVELYEHVITLKKMPPYFPFVVNDLASFLFKTQHYDAAEIFFNIIYQTIQEEKEANLISHKYPKMVYIMNTARYYTWKEDYEKATELALIISQFYKEQMNMNALFLDETLRESFWNTLNPLFSLFYKIASNSNSGELAELCYNNQLTNKAILLNSTLKIKEIIQSSEDKELKRIDTLYRQERQQLLQSLQSNNISSQYIQGQIIRVKDMEAQLMEKISPYLSIEKPVTWKQIQQNLKDHEAAIEFVSFDDYDFNKNNNTYYIALLIKKNAPYPKIIPLCEQKQLTSLMKELQQDDPELKAKSINNFYHWSDTNNNNIYNLLWKQIEQELPDSSRIYFSTSGSLNQIAFHAIQNEKATCLGANYDLYQLSSTRLLVKGDIEQPLDKRNAAVFGQMDYDFSKTNTKKQPVATTLNNPKKSNSIENLNDKKEVDNIISYYQESNIPISRYLGSDAIEESFKALDGNAPASVYISTHGYYIPADAIDEYPWLNKDRALQEKYPMQRSLIVFSGAKNYWNNKTEQTPNNGILQADEISDMNLSGLDLLVLSACETALGDFNHNEGVFGLQRAFKLAGTNTMVMTLWEVPEKDASVFMKTFYKAMLIDGKSKHKAFQIAQEEMRTGTRFNTYNWAAFIMID